MEDDHLDEYRRHRATEYEVEMRKRIEDLIYRLSLAGVQPHEWEVRAPSEQDPNQWEACGSGPSPIPGDFYLTAKVSIVPWRLTSIADLERRTGSNVYINILQEADDADRRYPTGSIEERTLQAFHAMRAAGLNPTAFHVRDGDAEVAHSYGIDGYSLEGGRRLEMVIVLDPFGPPSDRMPGVRVHPSHQSPVTEPEATDGPAPQPAFVPIEMLEPSPYRQPRTDPVPDGHKRCSRCEVDYAPPEDHFHKGSGKADGLDGWCTTCVGQRSKRLRQMKEGA